MTVRDTLICDAVIGAIKDYDKPPTWAEICCEIYQMGFNEQWDPTQIMHNIHAMQKDGLLIETPLGGSNGRTTREIATLKDDAAKP